MKRFLISIALLLCMSALFISCNKDGGSSSSSIVGTWGMVKEEIFDKDGNLFHVEYYDANKDKFVFSESSLTIYIDNASQYTLAYQYDSSTKKLFWGPNVDAVQKLTAKELVLKSIDEGIDRYNIMYLEKK